MHTSSPSDSYFSLFNIVFSSVSVTNHPVMPDEVDHVDELIEEYDGREDELLDALTAMRDAADDDDEEFGIATSEAYGAAGAASVDAPPA